MESLMLGMNVALNKEKAMKCCPVSYVTPSAPPFMIFHGTLVAINGAEHADIFFAQEKLWDMVAKFFKDKLYQ